MLTLCIYICVCVGAFVRLFCETSLHAPVAAVAKTDKNGYFFFPPNKKVSSFGAQKRCRVYLISAPEGSKCDVPTNLHEGGSGASLRPTKSAKPVDFALYTVGPFAFAPSPSSCPKL